MADTGGDKSLTPQSSVKFNRRLVVWGADGLPAPATVPLLSKPQIDALAAAALSLPYSPVPPSEALPKEQYEVAFNQYLAECAEFEGMTNAEVMYVRLARKAAEGDKEATTVLLDRVLGKPKQSVESKSMKLTYEDYLQELARSSSSTPKQPSSPTVDATVDATIVDPNDNLNLEGLI